MKRSWLVLLALVSGVVAPAVAATSAAPAARPARPPAPSLLPPASKRVYVVTDSVGLSAKNTIPAAFPPDWQVTVDGTAALFVEQLLSKHVNYRRATNPSVFGDYAIVAGGYNYPYWDPARFDRSIDSMVASLLAAGTKHVFWVTLREVKPEFISASAWRGAQPYYWYFPTVNEHLRNALLRHPQLSLIDWAANADQPNLTYDSIHLNTNGGQVYSNLAAGVVQTTANRQPGGTITRIKVAGQHGVAADAVAVTGNLTVVNPRTFGYLSAYPCGDDVPLVSNMNVAPGQVLAASVVVPIGDDGSICIFQLPDAHVIFDLTGAFGADSGYASLIPERAIDTRVTPVDTLNAPIQVDVGHLDGVPLGSQSVMLNVTTIGGWFAGDIRVFTCGTPAPTTSSRPIAPGQIQNLLVMVRPDANGKICVQRTTAADFIVDVFGAFEAGADMHPLATERVLDTRGGSPVAAHSTTPVQLGGTLGLPAAPNGVVVSLAVYHPSSLGFAALYPCAEGLPLVSMLNTTPNHDQFNATVVAPDSSGALCAFLLTGTHLTLDLTGWLGVGFLTLTPTRLFDSRA